MSDQKFRAKTGNMQKICFTVIIGCLLIILSYLVWFLRDTVLISHDSMLAFANARMLELSRLFEINLDYDLARGRLCIIFPLVATFRDLVLKTGSYPLIWMLQYVPIAANVTFLSVLLAKRFGRFIGLLTALLFFVFLQIDIYHSLVICYPLDFMYGLFCFQLSVYLFLKYADGVAAGRTDRRQILLVVFSIALYYESLVVYESFLTSMIVFAILSLAYAVKMRAIAGTREIAKRFLRLLWPYFAISAIYLGIYFALRAFPVTETRTIALDTNGSVDRFFQTWPTFATNMFPVRQFFDNNLQSLGTSVWNGYRLAWVAGGAAAIGCVAAITGLFSDMADFSAEKLRSLRIRLAIAGLAGGLFAILYTLPHGMTPKYQEWCVLYSIKGYVPSTICYFGWVVMCVSLLGLLFSFVASRGRVLRITVSLLLAGIFGTGWMMTVASNHLHHKTYDLENIEARNLYATVTSDDYKERGYDLLFTDTFRGIHLQTETNEWLIEYETQSDVEFMNRPEDFITELEEARVTNNDDAVYLHEDFVANLLFVIPFDSTRPEASDPETFPANVMSNEMWVISAIGGTFHIEYQNSAGITVARDIQLAPGELTNVPVDSVMITSVTARAIE